MCNKAVGNYLEALSFIPECYKTQEMCDKAVDTYASTIKFAVDTYASTIKFVPECFMTQEMCAVNRCFFGIYFYSWLI